MPSGQQMLSGAQKANNFMNQVNNNNTNTNTDNKAKKTNVSTLANLFGSGAGKK